MTDNELEMWQRLADISAAAREYEARVRAPVEAERDQLSMALAEVREKLKRSAAFEFHERCGSHSYCHGCDIARVVASLPADLAAQREARIRADERTKALREAQTIVQNRNAASCSDEPIGYILDNVAIEIGDLADEAGVSR